MSSGTEYLVLYRIFVAELKRKKWEELNFYKESLKKKGFRQRKNFKIILESYFVKEVHSKKSFIGMNIRKTYFKI